MWSYAVWWRHVSKWSTNHWHRCSGTENDNRIYSFPEGEDATRKEQEGGEGGQNHKLLSAWPLRVLLWSGWIQRVESGSGWQVKDPPLTLFVPITASKKSTEAISSTPWIFAPCSNFSFKALTWWKLPLFKLHRVGGVRPVGLELFLRFPRVSLTLAVFKNRYLSFTLSEQASLSAFVLWASEKSVQTQQNAS